MQEAVRRLCHVFVAMLALVIATTAIGATAGATALAVGPSFTDAERHWLAQHPALTAVFHDASLPPVLHWAADGDASGMVGDYLALLSARSGLQFRMLRVDSLAARDAALRDGRADLAPLVLVGDAVDPNFRLTSPFLLTQAVWLTRRETGDFSPTGNLGDRPVAVTMGSAHEAWLRRRHPGARVLPVGSPLEQVQALADRRADAAIAILPLATYVVETHHVGQLTVRAYAPDAPNRYAMGMRADATLLHAVLEKALATITPEDHDAIVQKWMPARHYLRLDATLALTDAERDWIRRQGRVRVAYDREFAPYTLEHDHAMQGLGADLLQELARRLGVSLLEQRPGTWAEAYGAARRGEVDMLVAAGRNLERREEFRFVGPWSSSPTALVVAGASPGLLTLADLGAGPLAIQDDHFLLPMLQRRHPAIELQRHPTLSGVLDAVREGRAQAGLGNLQVLSRRIQQDHPGALTVAGTVADGDSELYFAVRQDHPELASVLQKALASMSDGDRLELRTRWLAAVYRPEWSWHELLARLWPWLVGASLLALLMLRHQRRLRVEIARRQQAQDALSLSVQRLQQVSTSKSRFIASLGHEIRQPLSSMIAAAELLQQRVLDDTMARLVRSIADAGQHLLELLGRSLDFSRAESGLLTLHPEWVAIDAWLHRTAGAYRAAAERKGLGLDVDGTGLSGLELRLDPIRMAQVLSNLLSNAVKFSPQGTVRVVLRVDEAAGELQLSVADDGPGVAEADRQRMFLPYTQLPSAAAGQGHGLGLALCQQLVEQMGGRIEVHSAPGRGTRFEVVVPVEARHAGGTLTAAPASAQHGHWPPARVLLIDDDPVGRLVHAEVLRAGGWSVEDCGDPVVALERWPRDPVGLVLVDVQMPGLDGPGFASRLRERAAASGAQPCIVALTGEDDPAVHARCRASGMDAVLVKPLRLAALHGCLAPLAARYGLRPPPLRGQPAADAPT